MTINQNILLSSRRKFRGGLRRYGQERREARLPQMCFPRSRQNTDYCKAHGIAEKNVADVVKEALRTARKANA
jgi:hypothetical protein